MVELQVDVIASVTLLHQGPIQGFRYETDGEPIFEYIYHQILRKDHDWVARDLFRERFRQNADLVDRHGWDQADVGCLLLYTSHEVMLDELLERSIESGDLLSNANTIILMGKTRRDDTMGRALHIAKHRGSACDERIVPYTISDEGLVL